MQLPTYLRTCKILIKAGVLLVLLVSSGCKGEPLPNSGYKGKPRLSNGYKGEPRLSQSAGLELKIENLNTIVLTNSTSNEINLKEYFLSTRVKVKNHKHKELFNFTAKYIGKGIELVISQGPELGLDNKIPLSAITNQSTTLLPGESIRVKVEVIDHSDEADSIEMDCCIFNKEGRSITTSLSSWSVADPSRPKKGTVKISINEGFKILTKNHNGTPGTVLKIHTILHSSVKVDWDKLQLESEYELNGTVFLQNNGLLEVGERADKPLTQRTTTVFLPVEVFLEYSEEVVREKLTSGQFLFTLCVKSQEGKEIAKETQEMRLLPRPRGTGP